MELTTILQVFLFGIALSMDALAVSVTQGLTYTDLNKKRKLFIATTYGLFQAMFPLIGFWLIEGICQIVGLSAGEKAGSIMSLLVSWISFVLLLYIGIKMLVEAIKDMKREEGEKKVAKFSLKEVLLMGVATAIDALATGVAFHAGISTPQTIIIHVTIIMLTTFVISLFGIILANKVHKLLKGKYEITGIIGGIILILLAIWVILSHYFGI